MLAAAFLSTAVAVADSEGGGAELSDAAFTAGEYTFDPEQTDADYALDLGPLFQTGAADYDVDLYDEDGEELLGSFTSSDDDVVNILGITNTDFTFDSDNFTAADTNAGGSGSEDGGDVDASAIEDALIGAGITDDDFGEDQNVESLAQALASGDLNFDGNITGDDVVDALQGTEVADDFDIELDEGDSGEFTDDVDFTKGDVAAALNDTDAGSGDGDAADLPADGTDYNVTDFGMGIQTIYESVPADDGGSAEINDTLVTPLGEFDLSPLFNPTSIFSDFHGLLNDLFGVDDDFFDDLGDGGSGDGGSEVGAADIEGGLEDSDTDFSAVDLSSALADNVDFDDGALSGSDVSDAIADTEVADDVLDVDGDGGFDDVDFTSDDLADALNDVEAGGDGVDAVDVAGALDASETDFSDGDLASALAASDLDFGGDVSGGDVVDALEGLDDNGGNGVVDALDIEDGGFSDTDFSPADLADAIDGLF